ncbi:Putative signal peptide peptidase SppA [Oceanibacterium hippocampi]|uniref:Putative signal peptide peptidase SppA n=2 Tax=Oceanibacterium hippocampi TaxID=745714 RepID=A0A1Y5TTU9_9PROT|nr:S49 family peptidase [Oceanibacterium hippocampi]SLN72495.1 Putative signal peptide peptidase SppA [Oceanibacterium hippocampi]
MTDRLRSLLPARFRERPPVVAVIRLAGVIAPGGSPLRGPNLNLAGLAGPIERAFSIKGVKAVALVINSPGGSPVQSALISARIRQFAAEKKVPVIAFTEDVAASGGYWLALAADEIYADENSIVGSIGVVSAGFGFPGLLDKLGIERRVHTAGEEKALLDPFRPEREEDIARLKELQGDIYDSFKAHVQDRRGDRLKTRRGKEIFSGRVWTGRKALALGLIDGIGELRGEMRRRYGEKVKLRLIGGEKSWLRRRMGLAGSGGAEALVDAVMARLEARLHWARFGL